MEEFLRWVPLLILIAIVVWIVVYDRRRRALSPSLKAEGPIGIGGWLILPAIAIIIGPLVALTNVLALITYVRSPLVEAAERSVAFAEMAASAAIGAFGLYVAVRFFQYRKDAPKLYIILALAATAYTIIDYVVVTSVLDLSVTSDNTGPLIGAPLLGTPLYAVIWIVYMMQSVRVRNTFTR